MTAGGRAAEHSNFLARTCAEAENASVAPKPAQNLPLPRSSAHLNRVEPDDITALGDRRWEAEATY